jgi:hypothetical protein
VADVLPHVWEGSGIGGGRGAMEGAGGGSCRSGPMFRGE